MNQGNLDFTGSYYNTTSLKGAELAERREAAGSMEPNDSTHYEMVVVEKWDTYEVVILNDSFFDKICFIKSNVLNAISSSLPIVAYGTYRGPLTNVWTIRAATFMLIAYLEKNGVVCSQENKEVKIQNRIA